MDGRIPFARAVFILFLNFSAKHLTRGVSATYICSRQRGFVNNPEGVLPVNNRAAKTVPSGARRKNPEMTEMQTTRPTGDEVRVQLEPFENRVIDALKIALAEVKALLAARRRAKLSVSRVAGVARELGELIKVLTNYGC